MTFRTALLALALAGCNTIFGLNEGSHGGDDEVADDDAISNDTTDDSPDDGAPVECMDMGQEPDEDGDDKPDRCDPCPWILHRGPEPDTDHDGIGNQCDPRPDDEAHPDTLHFVGMPEIPPTPKWHTIGPWQADAGQLTLPGGTDGYIEREEPATGSIQVMAEIVLPGGTTAEYGYGLELGDAGDLSNALASCRIKNELMGAGIPELVSNGIAQPVAGELTSRHQLEMDVGYRASNGFRGRCELRLEGGPTQSPQFTTDGPSSKEPRFVVRGTPGAVQVEWLAVITGD